MEQIPNDSSEERITSDYDKFEKEFKTSFSRLMEPIFDISNQIQELIESKMGEVSDSDASIAINDKIVKLTNSYLQKKSNFIIEQLKKRLEYIVKNYSITALDNIFDVLISSLIKNYKHKQQIFFITFEQIYEMFNLYGFRIIPGETIDKLTGALQWDIISHYWLNYNFLKGYFDKILSKKEISKELKNKTWTLVELTRIKKQELEKSFNKNQFNEEYYKI